MSSSESKKPLPRKKPSYAFSILGITLVLFVLGILATILMQANILASEIKGNLLFQIELKDDVSEAQISNLLTQFEQESYTRKVTITYKEQAAEMLKEKVGDDNFIELLGYNPLYTSIDLRLNNNYIDQDSLAWIKTSILEIPSVKNLNYNQSLVAAIERNLTILGIILLVLATILFVVCITIIDNTIRLAMFSQRFLIRSMQLVGATRQFITAPFLKRSIYNGLVSGILASLGVLCIFAVVEYYISSISVVNNILYFLLIVMLLIGIGVFVSWFSTSRAVKKYLNMRLDDLY